MLELTDKACRPALSAQSLAFILASNECVKRVYRSRTSAAVFPPMCALYSMSRIVSSIIVLWDGFGRQSSSNSFFSDQYADFPVSWHMKKETPNEFRAYAFLVILVHVKMISVVSKFTEGQPQNKKEGLKRGCLGCNFVL